MTVLSLNKFPTSSQAAGNTIEAYFTACRVGIRLGRRNFWYNFDMNEKIKSIDNQSENIPSIKEVALKFEKILDGREFTELKKIEDEEGLYIWEIETTDDDGDRLTMEFKRAGESETGVASDSRIRETLYVEDVPCGAGDQYIYINSDWKRVP